MCGKFPFVVEAEGQVRIRETNGELEKNEATKQRKKDRRTRRTGEERK